MKIEEINAVLGIDAEAATSTKFLARAAEFCDEMADCYKPGTLERLAFGSLRYALCHAIGHREDENNAT